MKTTNIPPPYSLDHLIQLIDINKNTQHYKSTHRRLRMSSYIKYLVRHISPHALILPLWDTLFDALLYWEPKMTI
jgi:hypothetical protein